MRALLASVAAAALACAGPRPVHHPAVSFAHPEPDPACRLLVAETMRLTNLEQIKVGVALLERGSALDRGAWAMEGGVWVGLYPPPQGVSVELLGPEHGVALQILGPDLTPAQAEEVRRAFPNCLWRPGAGGVRIGIVEFSRP